MDTIRYSYNSIFEAFLDYAQKTPDKLFVVENKKKYTYREALCVVYGYAKHLKEIGIEEGECVVVKTSQSAAPYFCDFALQLIHAIYVPLEKVVAADRVNFIIEKTDARYFISDKELEGVNAEYICLKDIYNYTADVSELPESFDIPAGDTTGQILFTTGTTGTSKGVEMSNAASVRISENIINAIGINSGDVEVITSPINHAFGLRRSYAVIVAGGSLVVMDGIVFIDRLWKAFDEYGVTGISLVPAALAVIFKLSGSRIADYRNQLKYIQIGSAVLPVTDKEKLCEYLPDTKLFDFYGCSEAGCVCTADFNQYRDKKKSLGKPTCNSIFKLILEDGTYVDYPATGIVGRLAYTGSIRMKGYWKEPELTEKTMHDGYIVTSDLAQFDEDGFIYLLGRADDVINSGGAKIAPTEIEEVVMQMPGVADCAVIGAPDPIAGEVPKLFVVMEEGTEFDPVKINSFMLDKLEAYKTPKIIVTIDAIPRTYNGKILRRELKNK